MVFTKNASECCPIFSYHGSEGSINHKTILPVDAESYNFENHIGIFICCRTHLKSLPAFPSKLVAAALFN